MLSGSLVKILLGVITTMANNKAKIMHGKKGSHLVPHKGSHYD